MKDLTNVACLAVLGLTVVSSLVALANGVEPQAAAVVCGPIVGGCLALLQRSGVQ